MQLVRVCKNGMASEERIDLSSNYCAVFPKHPNYRDLSSCMVFILEVATLTESRLKQCLSNICTESSLASHISIPCVVKCIERSHGR